MEIPQFVIFMIGVPCSGKSTVAKDIASKNPLFKIVSRDAIRTMLYGEYKMISEDEKMISDIQDKIVKEILKSGRSVILDNTHCNLKFFKKDFEKYLLMDGCEVEIRIFDLDEETFEKRNQERKEKTGKDIPKNVFERMVKGKKEVEEYLNSMKDEK